MGIGQILKKVDAFPKIIDIEVNKTFSGALRKSLTSLTILLRVAIKNFPCFL
jgi:hypothetical protein